MILFLLQHSYINENSDVMKSLFLLKYQYAEGGSFDGVTSCSLLFLPVDSCLHDFKIG